MTRATPSDCFASVRTGSWLAFAVVAALSGALTTLSARVAPPGYDEDQVATERAAGIILVHADTPIERELSGGEAHTYQLPLEAGEYARLTVEQRGIDVVVQFLGADGGVIADFQDEIRTRGEEQVEVVAEAAGHYTLTVKAALGRVAPGSYAIRTADAHAATDRDRSMQDARKLRSASGRRLHAGKYDEARALLERALAIAEGVQRPDDTYVATLTGELANVFQEQLDYAKAESLYQRALSVIERTLGAEHPATALLWARLGAVYTVTGQRPRAEQLLQRALDVTEKTLGPEHPQVAGCLLALGLMRHGAADLEKAEEVDRRAIAILEKTRSTKTMLFARLLNNLGIVYIDKEDYERPGELFRRSLAIIEKLQGTQGISIANTLQNLGLLARQHRDYAKAEEYYLRALSIRQAVVGPDHPDLAATLNNLANIYRAKGDVARSLETHFRALHIWEKSGGPYYGGTLFSLGNIARTYAATGDRVNAIAFQRRADAVIETQLALNLAIGSERQKLAFVESVSERTDRTISLDLDVDDPDASALAALVLLQRKGRVLDAMTDTLAAVRQRLSDATDQEPLDQLNKTTARLARLVLNGPQGMRPEEHQRAIKELEGDKEKLEARISEHSAEFRARSQAVTLEAVQAAIPADAALVEFAVFRPFDPKAERNSDAYGAPHYAAYVLRRHAAPHGRDLGPVGAIDTAVDALRQTLRDPTRTELKPFARAVHEKVIQPIRAWLGDATRLLISPDGELNLVPFEALRDQQDRYLVEQYAISYLTSGRDLLRMQVPRLSKSEPVIIADPLFGEPPIANGDQQNSASTRTRRRSVTTAEDLSSVYFAPLAGTAQEARAIKSLFPEAKVLSRQQATKAALEQVDAPRILHIATHGFFLQAARGPTVQAPPATGVSTTRAINAAVRIENPLLRSGVALAGANLKRGPRDDGILTALEASGLNLWGTKLVALSACDTGVGEVRNGEGVYGLRRAFFLAGAETLVMSLWPVSDSVTREMMTAYYRGLKEGLGRGEALRQAQLAMLTRNERQHPFYWASFIQAGEWATLDGHR